MVPQLVGVCGIPCLTSQTESDIKDTIVSIGSKLHHGDTTVVVVGFGKKGGKFGPAVRASGGNVVGGREC